MKNLLAILLVSLMVVSFVSAARDIFDLLADDDPADCTSQNNYPLYKQCDSNWGSNQLGSSTTVSFK